jgi:hypothetical protein
MTVLLHSFTAMYSGTQAGQPAARTTGRPRRAVLCAFRKNVARDRATFGF